MSAEIAKYCPKISVPIGYREVISPANGTMAEENHGQNKTWMSHSDYEEDKLDYNTGTITTNNQLQDNAPRRNRLKFPSCPAMKSEDPAQQ
jgi:hypothetical protein